MEDAAPPDAELGAEDLGAGDLGTVDLGAGDLGAGDLGVSPDMAPPADATTQDLDMGEAMQPDAEALDAEIPDAEIPDTPDVEAPDMAWPDAELPDAEIPDADLPDEGAVCVPAQERCDGADNDCDGATDEGYNLGAECSVGIGACLAQGTIQCAGGEGRCDAVAGAAGDEICDDLDNDCDGATDEGVSRACYEGPFGTEGLGTCVGGEARCVAGEWQSCEGQVLPLPEQCDAADNDCDGITDEVLDWQPIEGIQFPEGAEIADMFAAGDRLGVLYTLPRAEGDTLLYLRSTSVRPPYDTAFNDLAVGLMRTGARPAGFWADDVFYVAWGQPDHRARLARVNELGQIFRFDDLGNEATPDDFVFFSGPGTLYVGWDYETGASVSLIGNSLLRSEPFELPFMRLKGGFVTVSQGVQLPTLVFFIHGEEGVGQYYNLGWEYYEERRLITAFNYVVPHYGQLSQQAEGDICTHYVDDENGGAVFANLISVEEEGNSTRFVVGYPLIGGAYDTSERIYRISCQPDEFPRVLWTEERGEQVALRMIDTRRPTGPGEPPVSIDISLFHAAPQIQFDLIQLGEVTVVNWIDAQGEPSILSTLNACLP